MAFYTHFHRRANAIFLRYVDDRGIRRSHVIKDYKPKLFTKTNKPTGFKSIYGHHLQPIPLENIKSGQEFVERYKGVDGFDIYGNTNWEYACINERFDGDMVYDETKIRTVFIDIETEVGDKFPDPHLAEQRINLITLFDGSIYRMWAFQQIDIDPIYEGKQTDFRIFETEEAMLRDFLRFWKGDYPDVLCGYNSEGFDLPYIVNRIKSQLGEEKAKELSPVNSLYVKMGDSGPIHTLKGIEHLDFLQLIKKFMPGERDFSLDAVGEDMLGEKKLENPFSSFREFYQRDFNLFSAYNRHDVGLLVKLEAKLKLISLAFSVSYMIKMNFSDCFGTIKPWDTFIQNYLARRNEFVPATFDIRPPDRQIAGGFVKDPIAGKYKWVVSFDATSLYPSIIRTFNISPETILDSHEIPSDLLPYYNKEHHESLLANPDSDLTKILKKHNVGMTLNGQFFRRDKQGLIPELTAYVFDERVKAKNEMKAWKKKREQLVQKLKEMEGGQTI